ncbi:MAG: hypothetical protein ABFS10_00840 [Bacteroidota bacterium]
MDRRRFIEQMARGGVLAGMALGTGFLLVRRQVTLQQDCGLNYQCRGCKKIEECRLPEAREERATPTKTAIPE